MANSWLRLWHDMPNDPKWRTIAKAAKQPITAIIAVYLHMLVCASQASFRGRLESFSPEDVASALDLDCDAVDAIVSAMHGRVIGENQLLGWKKRQPIREDIGNPDSGAKSSTQRVREHRKRTHETQSMKRNETQCNDPKREKTKRNDQDKDKDTENVSLSNDRDCSQQVADRSPDCPHQKIIALYARHLPELPQPRIWEGQRAKNLQSRWRWVLTASKPSGEHYASTPSEAIAFFDRLFGYVAASDFLTGRDGNWQACDLGWIVKAENFAKIIEGKYENRKAA